MNLLLDTHALIWFLESNPLLSEKSKSLILDSDTVVSISIASLWEMAIKLQTGKLNLSKSLETIIVETKVQQISILQIETPHIITLQSLPLHHRDPFDRIIIAQAITENLQIVSKDEHFDLYEVAHTW